MEKAMLEAEGIQQQALLRRRFEAMGLEAKPAPGGRCILVDLPFGREPLVTLGPPRGVRTVRFATVGVDRIKCLSPRALFYLPLIRIAGCTKPTDLEARIRGAWNQQLDVLRRTRDWLARLGVEFESPRGTPQWVFRLDLQEKRARAAAIEPNRLILPSTGPLSGFALERPEDRNFRPDPGCASAVDLEIAITNRLEELACYAKRVREQRRRGADDDTPRSLEVLKRAPPILFVGPKLFADRTLRDSLHIRGFRVSSARSLDEAVALFYERSFELVLADTRLDRADGIELVPVLRAVPGIEEVPVVLVDDRPREPRRTAARSAGATGYVARPLSVPRLSVALARLINAPRRRRFTRYRRAVSVSWSSSSEPSVAQNIGRGGMLVRSDREIPGDGLIRFQIHLPEIGTELHVDAEVAFRLKEPQRHRIGVHFRSFLNGSERVWIDFLRSLEPRPSRVTGGRVRS